LIFFVYSSSMAIFGSRTKVVCASGAAARATATSAAAKIARPKGLNFILGILRDNLNSEERPDASGCGCRPAGCPRFRRRASGRVAPKRRRRASGRVAPKRRRRGGGPGRPEHRIPAVRLRRCCEADLGVCGGRLPGGQEQRAAPAAVEGRRLLGQGG